MEMFFQIIGILVVLGIVLLVVLNMVRFFTVKSRVDQMMRPLTEQEIVFVDTIFGESETEQKKNCDDWIARNGKSIEAFQREGFRQNADPQTFAPGVIVIADFLSKTLRKHKYIKKLKSILNQMDTKKNVNYLNPSPKDFDDFQVAMDGNSRIESGPSAINTFMWVHAFIKTRMEEPEHKENWAIQNTCHEFLMGRIFSHAAMKHFYKPVCEINGAHSNDKSTFFNYLEQSYSKLKTSGWSYSLGFDTDDHDDIEIKILYPL
ncbi:hypothetical protein N9M21_09005 [Alphaproteobacteria bacterium]|nr:hypothetical protein [Alphaproteobacteria bacterium]